MTDGRDLIEARTSRNPRLQRAASPVVRRRLGRVTPTTGMMAARPVVVALA
jgi:hypothetical protein